ncbi:MAG: nitrilase-related carbon-nitrogen hydrolase [bacterium]
MKVAVLQFSPVFGKIEANLTKVEDHISKESFDLIVLPELFNTGYLFTSKDEVKSLAENIPEGFTTKELSRIARKKDAFIAAGLAEREDGNLYNSAVLVGPKGFIGQYRKVHLFNEEKFWFTPGNLEFPVFDIGIARLGIMICFDWIFPEATRILTLKGAELICHPANLILPFCQKAMITRSIENRVICITANRTGIERRTTRKELKFTGGSQIVNAEGRILLRLSQEETIGTVNVDPRDSRNKHLTDHNDLFADRRPELYSLLTSQTSSLNRG